MAERNGCGIAVVCDDEGDMHLKIADHTGELIVGVRMDVEQAMTFAEKWGDELAKAIALHERATGVGGTA